MKKCKVCGGDIQFIEASSWNGTEDEIVDSWWAHADHPDDNHDAEPVIS